ncbi:MAG: iron-sulfur cluster insertion protein ErpA [Anaerolinea sp.]|nr:iron-sulfur cluster insertion protein ErpA [Anaerolinea sp.]MCC6972821.1 iron-sulfur cluster insertion protein ErpA [Anaerolineae bacterium]CAG0950933.1 Iron-sulfur cluster insertion protein ErpA [Anaerolineae bacterium]
MTDLIQQENTQTDVVDEPTLVVTPMAAAKIKELLTVRNIPDHALRVFVSGGGCSGLQYGMAFEGNPQEYDTLIEAQDGIRIVIDPTSLMYISGATIDFVDSLMGGGFRIDNPNAVSSCGCGSSFRTKSEGGTSSDGGCGCGGH